MTDFEQAAIGAITDAFPGIVLVGCHFHLSQALFRRIQGEGLQAAYAEQDGRLATQARSFAALAMIPLNHVQDYFQALIQSDDFDHRLDGFVAYFEETWIGSAARPALFPPALWNVRDRVLQDEPKTNNNLGKH